MNPATPDWMQGRWDTYKVGALKSVESNCTEEKLREFLDKLTAEPPKEFTLHKRMARLLDAKKSMGKVVKMLIGEQQNPRPLPVF